MANEGEAPEERPVDWERIILKFMEEQREAIADGLRNWGQGGIRRGRALYAIIAFMAGIVGGTGFLTVIGVLPGEAFAFLVGIILMYLFNLLGPRIQVA